MEKISPVVRHYTKPSDETDVDLVFETTIESTQELLSSDDSSLKHKVVYIAGFLAHKHKI